MGSDLTVGGLSALELQGFAHYLPLSGEATIHLDGRMKLPEWASHLRVGARFVAHNAGRLFAPSSAESGDDFTVDGRGAISHGRFGSPRPKGPCWNCFRMSRPACPSSTPSNS